MRISKGQEAGRCNTEAKIHAPGSIRCALWEVHEMVGFKQGDTVPNEPFYNLDHALPGGSFDGLLRRQAQKKHFRIGELRFECYRSSSTGPSE
jgi:hypothetical protein